MLPGVWTKETSSEIFIVSMERSDSLETGKASTFFVDLPDIALSL